MKLVNKPLRVTHIPVLGQIGFSVEVNNEREAFLVEQALASQHLFLLNQGIIEDYSNVIFVEMMENEWEDYYNEQEMMEWDEFVYTYEDYCNGK